MINQNSKNKKLPTFVVLTLGLLGICMGSTQLDSDQLPLSKEHPNEALSADIFKDFTPKNPLEDLPQTHESELNLEVDAFAEEPQFSDAAKKLIKEKTVPILKSGDPLKALPDLLDPSFENDAQTQQLIGNIYFQNGKVAEAEKHYILSFNAHAFPRPLKNLIILYVQTGNYPAAGKLTEKFIELAATTKDIEVDADLFLIAGACAMHSKNYELAEERLVKSLALEPEDKNALLNLFQVFMFAAEYKEAEPILVKIIKLTDDPVELANYYKYYANLEIGLDAPSAALEKLEILINMVEANKQITVHPTTFAMATSLAFNMENYEKSLEIAERYIALTDNRADLKPDAGIYFTAGLNAMFLKKYELALQRLETCLELDPSHLMAKEQLEKVKEILG